MNIPPEHGLQSTDVLKAVNLLSYKVLDYWARSGAVTPSIRAADGHGTTRLWSQRDVAVLTAIAQVRADLINIGGTCELPLVGQLWERLHDTGNVRLTAGTVSISVGLV